jgi:hypothetical protein
MKMAKERSLSVKKISPLHGGKSPSCQGKPVQLKTYLFAR